MLTPLYYYLNHLVASRNSIHEINLLTHSGKKTFILSVYIELFVNKLIKLNTNNNFYKKALNKNFKFLSKQKKDFLRTLFETQRIILFLIAYAQTYSKFKIKGAPIGYVKNNKIKLGNFNKGRLEKGKIIYLNSKNEWQVKINEGIFKRGNYYKKNNTRLYGFGRKIFCNGKMLEGNFCNDLIWDGKGERITETSTYEKGKFFHNVLVNGFTLEIGKDIIKSKWIHEYVENSLHNKNDFQQKLFEETRKKLKKNINVQIYIDKINPTYIQQIFSKGKEIPIDYYNKTFCGKAKLRKIHLIPRMNNQPLFNKNKIEQLDFKGMFFIKDKKQTTTIFQGTKIHYHISSDIEINLKEIKKNYDFKIIEKGRLIHEASVKYVTHHIIYSGNCLNLKQVDGIRKIEKQVMSQQTLEILNRMSIVEGIIKNSHVVAPEGIVYDNLNEIKWKEEFIKINSFKAKEDC
ncbi:MAG: hypothetical protein Q8K60_03325 [Parachlamydiaceae bacterium]|nr:hypothetical protein [Parachlamydiaceae bacterium]